MPRTAATSTTPDRCPLCAGTALVRRITTYPVELTGPAPLRGKQIHVNRVALHQCESCGHLMPTRAGQAKVDRLVARSIELFLGQLP
jgi:ribosomal protein L37AE/L43A